MHSSPKIDTDVQQVLKPNALKIANVRVMTKLAAALLTLIILYGPALADKIVFPAPVLERNRQIKVVYRLDKPASGNGNLDLEWSDADGRIVARWRLPFELVGSSDVPFYLDTRRAVATLNELRVHLTFDGADTNGRADRRQADQAIAFSVPPSNSGWPDYQIIMWQPRTVAQYAALKTLGITAAVAETNRGDFELEFIDHEIAPLLKVDLCWYVENIATDFYSAYHRWFPDRPVNWRFSAAKKIYRQNPLSTAAFMRNPSLSDPVWLGKIRDRLGRIVNVHRAYQPLYYNLGDEPGIADLAAFWDFDFSPPSLQGMRTWLEEQYGSLSRLNAQWGSRFAGWDQVMPMTTREAMARTDDNYSAWADFKAWMDVAFARALRAGTDAVHAADPSALAAIEGAQIPGWGGYDYTQLSKAVDVMELYDYGDNVEIVRSLNPKMVMLTTSAAAGPEDAHRIWRELLRGGRGLILWDEKDEFVREDGSLKTRGQLMTPLFRELRGGLADLLIESVRHTDPVAILYSPASLRTQWLLDHRRRGEAWSHRNAEAEYEANAIRSSTAAYVSAIEHMGLQQSYLSPELLETGALRIDGFRVLILPHSISLAPAMVDEIRRFFAQGGVIVADSEPGLYDQHGRRLVRPLLHEIFVQAPSGTSARSGSDTGKAIRLVPEALARADHATAGAGPGFVGGLAAVFAEAGIKPTFRLGGRAGEPISDVESYLFDDGAVSILALLRDSVTRAAHLDKDSHTTGAGDGENIILELQQSSYVYDLRAKKPLGETNRLAFTLNPYEPTILAISDTALPLPTIRAPAHLALGETAELNFALAAATPAAHDIFHVEVIGPGGNVVPYYSGNLVAHGGRASMPLPLALNDSAGSWHVRVTDFPSGQSAIQAISVDRQ